MSVPRTGRQSRSTSTPVGNRIEAALADLTPTGNRIEAALAGLAPTGNRLEAVFGRPLPAALDGRWHTVALPEPWPGRTARIGPTPSPLIGPAPAPPYPVRAGVGSPTAPRRALPAQIAARFPDLDRPRDPGLGRRGRWLARRAPRRVRDGRSGQPGGRGVPDRQRARSRAPRPARRRRW
ncbi:hypothetical protein ACIBPB_17610 [Micromonospora sp. NPDC049836]|uniref:hypothetical protein n=1 Tax=Micromonospora sp. NPDC049836 TaxID=3364274 RepID=UPI00378EC8C0